MTDDDESFGNEEELDGGRESPVAGQLHFPSVPSSGLKEWTYDMRRSMQEIVPGLFLGPYSSAKPAKPDYLLSNGITHIICVRCTMEAKIVRPRFPDRFSYLVLDIADCPTENIIQHFRAVRDFINESHERGGKTLIHGNAGISRSAALTIAFVMEKYGLTYKKAYDLLQTKRFCVNPNEGFAQQLMAFESIYLANLTCLGSNSDRSLKRNFEDIDRSMERMDTDS
ncbi:serine/threonine/tyrosine-interacting protein B-like isoform X2 [Thrips palmi]|nr:serine/threonine/tyrosine-interacting protein B-like isoform X2 [Thrips palmi]XP_034246992.1 serine/threonine/tyrosine-interacting protein B-like isoform X2 [Thrips palmi]XP_034246993.1 serine/threonine/tyrosine-interacting protein B-like isoform X2 [Thrips palmi]